MQYREEEESPVSHRSYILRDGKASLKSRLGRMLV